MRTFSLTDLILCLSADHFVVDVDSDLLGGIRIRRGVSAYSTEMQTQSDLPMYELAYRLYMSLTIRKISKPMKLEKQKEFCNVLCYKKGSS